MTQYLLSIMRPDGPPPAPAALDQIGRDLHVLNEQIKAAGRSEQPGWGVRRWAARAGELDGILDASEVADFEVVVDGHPR